MIASYKHNKGILMRNRAKCKLCNEILESFHSHDHVICSCGEISIDGGQQSFKCSAKDFTNFIRVDDEGKEHPVRFENPENPQSEENTTPWSQLNFMIENIERLPDSVMPHPISHYDFLSILLVLRELVRDK